MSSQPHECDCEARYSTYAALEACQGSNHGLGWDEDRKALRALAEDALGHLGALRTQRAAIDKLDMEHVDEAYLSVKALLRNLNS